MPTAPAHQIIAQRIADALIEENPTWRGIFSAHEPSAWGNRLLTQLVLAIGAADVRYLSSAAVERENAFSFTIYIFTADMLVSATGSGESYDDPIATEVRAVSGPRSRPCASWAAAVRSWQRPARVPGLAASR